MVTMSILPVRSPLPISVPSTRSAPGQHPQLRRGHRAAPVIVGVQGDEQAVAVGHMVTKPLDLVGVDIGCAHFHRGGQVDDHRALRRRPPDRGDGVADLDRELQLGAGEALRRVLEYPLGLGLFQCMVSHQFRAFHRNLENALAVQAEYLLALHRGRGVVHMHDGPAHALQGLEGPVDEVWPRLGEHLDGDVRGNAPLFDKLRARTRSHGWRRRESRPRSP